MSQPRFLLKFARLWIAELKTSLSLFPTTNKCPFLGIHYEIVDVTEEALKQTKLISNNIERLNAIAAEQDEIKYEPCEQCDSPYGCRYNQYCGQIKE